MKSSVRPGVSRHEYFVLLFLHELALSHAVLQNKYFHIFPGIFHENQNTLKNKAWKIKIKAWNWKRIGNESKNWKSENIFMAQECEGVPAARAPNTYVFVVQNRTHAQKTCHAFSLYFSWARFWHSGVFIVNKE